MFKNDSNPYTVAAILIGAGVGVGVAYLMLNKDAWRQFSGKMQELAQSCRKQQAEFKSTAEDLFEKGTTGLKDAARQTGKRMSERLAV